MRDYSKFSPLYWIGNTGNNVRELPHGKDCLIVGAYLMTAPSATMLGIYNLPIVTLARHTKLDTEGASKALRSLVDLGFCVYDYASEWVWVCEMAAWQIDPVLKPGDKRIKGVEKDWLALPNIPLLKGFFERYRDAFSLPERPNGKGPSKGHASPSEGPSKPGAGAGAGTRTGEPRRSAEPAGAASPQFHEELNLSPIFIELPLNTGDSWAVREALVAEWENLYPGVNVHQALRNMKGWLGAKSSRRKTKRGIRSFVTGWLSRCQDRGECRRAINGARDEKPPSPAMQRFLAGDDEEVPSAAP